MLSRRIIALRDRLHLLKLPSSRFFASHAQAPYTDASLLTVSRRFTPSTVASSLQITDCNALLQSLRKRAARNPSNRSNPSSSERMTIYHALRTLGLEDNTQEFVRNVEMLAIAQKVELLVMKGVAVSDVRALLSKRAFFAISFKALASILDLLTCFFKTGENAGKVLAQNSGNLSQPIEHLQRKLKLLDDFEVGKEACLRIGTATQNVLTMKSDSLHEKLAFLERIGLDVKSKDKLLCKFPRVLRLTIETSLQPTVDFFENRGMDRETILKLLRTRPEFFKMSLEKKVAKKFDLLKQLGFTTQESFRAIGVLAQSSSQRILTQCGYLKNHGFSDDDVSTIFRRQPDILVKSEESISKKIDYLLKVGNRDLKEIVRFPACLSYSLELRIVPRFSLLKEKDLLRKYSLSSILAIKDDSFKKRFMIKEPIKITT